MKQYHNKDDIYQYYNYLNTQSNYLVNENKVKNNTGRPMSAIVKHGSIGSAKPVRIHSSTGRRLTAYELRKMEEY